MYNQTHNTSSNSYQSLHQLAQSLEVDLEGSYMAGYYANYTSSSSSYGGSPTSNSIGAFERSISSLSLHKGSLLLPEDAPVRRVYSAGDLESVNSYMERRRRLQRAESPLSISNENSLIIQGIMKPTKYTPQEKKERIERYRHKRNQRNFHKKIQYTCRKTLADSRPRIKGRFVRNDEIATSSVTISATTMMNMMDGNYSTNSNCLYDDGDCSILNDEYSSSHQQYMMDVRDDLDDECQEKNSWINLFDCSFPSQYI